MEKRKILLRGAGECAALRRGNEPPISLFCEKEKRAVHGPKRNRFVSKSCPFGQVWTSTEVPTRDLGQLRQEPALGAAPVPLNLSAISPRPGIARSGCKTDLPCFSFRCRYPVQLREGNPKGRDRSPSPLSRFKGVRGEIEIPPGFSLGGEGGHFSFQKRNVPPSPGG